MCKGKVLIRISAHVFVRSTLVENATELGMVVCWPVLPLLHVGWLANAQVAE